MREPLIALAFGIGTLISASVASITTLQGALKDGSGEAVVVCDMPEPCKFLSLDSCQKRFLWTHKAVALALQPVIGLALQVGDADKFPPALGVQFVVS